jgi:hypothetical protein
MGRGAGRVWRPPASRVERAQPFSDEFWRFGLDKGTSIDFGQATRAAGAAAARVVEVVSAVRATPRPPYLTHARARATHRCGVDSSARVEHEAEGDYEDKVGVSTAAREAEGDDEDEAMAGDENVSVQRPEGISVVYYSNRCSLLLTAFCCVLVHFNAFNKISLHSILMHF